MQQAIQEHVDNADRVSMSFPKMESTGLAEIEEVAEVGISAPTHYDSIKEQTLATNVETTTATSSVAQSTLSENAEEHGSATNDMATMTVSEVPPSEPSVMRQLVATTVESRPFRKKRTRATKFLRTRNEWKFVSRSEVFAVITKCLDSCPSFQYNFDFQRHLKKVHGLCMLTNGLFLQQVSVLAVAGLSRDDDKWTTLATIFFGYDFDEGPISSTEAEEILKPCPKRCWLRNAYDPKVQRHWKIKHGLLNLNGNWYEPSRGGLDDSDDEDYDPNRSHSNKTDQNERILARLYRLEDEVHDKAISILKDNYPNRTVSITPEHNLNHYSNFQIVP